MVKVKLIRSGMEETVLYLAASPSVGSEIWLMFKYWVITRIVFYTVTPMVVVYAELKSEGGEQAPCQGQG